MTRQLQKTPVKKLNPFFESAAKIVDANTAYEHARQLEEQRRLKAIAARQRQIAREDKQLLAEQDKVYAESFKPVLESLTKLRGNDGSKLFEFTLDDAKTDYNSKRNRSIPVKGITLKFVPMNQVIGVTLISNEEANYSSVNSLNSNYISTVEETLQQLALRAMKWAPAEVGTLSKQQQRKAKAPAPKR